MSDSLEDRDYKPLMGEPKPLFGEPKRRDRVLNLVVGAFTSLAVVVTLISAFVIPMPPNGVNVFFAIIVSLICASHIFLIYWYRQGDIEPKFRHMIYFNAFTIILLCICGNMYIHGLGNLTTVTTCTTPAPSTLKPGV